MRHFRVIFFLAAVLGASTLVLAQQIQMLSGSALPQSGSHDWYSIEADPENPNNLIACGGKWSAQDNALYGFVYSSQDGGKVWHTALEDKSSRWVSEESCAFGVHGVVYFIAAASGIDRTGMPHHERGTMRIWVSHDSGRSWVLGTTAGWTDFSASVVDRNIGPSQNRLYIFFNSVSLYYSSVDDKGRPTNLPKPTDKINAFDTVGSTIGLLAYKDGDTQVNEPAFDPEMYKMRLRGSYPGQNLMLKDGSLLTLFWSKRRLFAVDGKREGREFIFGAQRTDPQRTSVSEPVVVQKAIQDAQPGQPEWKCSSYLSTPAAYDPKTNTVYATYLDGSNGKCTLMLEKSTDDGLTWSSSVWLEKLPDSKNAKLPEHDYLGLALAHRGDGTLVLLWRDSDKPNTWLFSSSTDDGKTYSIPQQISVGDKSDDGYSIRSESLDFYIGQAIETESTDDAGLRISNRSGGGTVHTDGIAVTSNGVFHPIWLTNEGQLYTASVAVTKLRDRTKQELPRTDGWRYETSKVKFTYGGSQHYDKNGDVLTETIVIRNSGIDLLKGPLRLEITPNSPVGVIYPLDAVTEGSGDGVAQYLDVDQYIPGDGLLPGASSTPIPLRFRFQPYSDAKQSGSVANVSLRLLSKGQEKSEAR